MQFQIERIILTAELDRHGETEVEDSNTDVIVVSGEGQKYIASFFAYRNIRTLAEENKRKREYLNGKYFWTENMVLIDQCSREAITQVIDHMLEEGEFNLVFKRIK